VKGGKALRVLPLYLGVGATGIVAIVSIPIMINASGLSSWANIGVGQSVGGVAASLVSYGWGITGPGEIAKGTPAQRRHEYFNSVRARLAITPLALLLAAVLTVSVTGPDGAAGGVLGLLSTSLTGLSAIYYFLGTGELWQSFLLDSLPRAAGTLVGTAALAWPGSSAGAIAVPIGTIAGVLLAFLLSTVRIEQGSKNLQRLPRQSLLTIFRERRHGLISSLTTGAFQVLPTVVVGWIAPSALSGYVFYDRIYKQVMTFLSPALNVFQGWVPRASGSELKRRMRAALYFGAVAGVGSFAGVVTLGWAATSLLSAGEVIATPGSLIAVGALIGFSAFDLVVSRVGLIVKDRLSTLATSSTASFLGGMLLLVILAPPLGTEGALAATAAGVGIRMIYASIAYLRAPWS